MKNNLCEINVPKNTAGKCLDLINMDQTASSLLPPIAPARRRRKKTAIAKSAHSPHQRPLPSIPDTVYVTSNANTAIIVNNSELVHDPGGGKQQLLYGKTSLSKQPECKLFTHHESPCSASYLFYKGLCANVNNNYNVDEKHVPMQTNGCEYHVQEISMYLDHEILDELESRRNAPAAAEEDLYESIYEVIRPRTSESESDFDEISEDPEYGHKPKTYEAPAKLTKLAEAAGKKMKKLRRDWSLKKSDISRSWSRIRKYSSPMIGGSNINYHHRPSFPVTINSGTISSMTGTGLKRKPSRRGNIPLPDTKSVVRQHGGPVVGDGCSGENDTTFYITLTIEQDDDEEDPLERLDVVEKGRKKKEVKTKTRGKRRVGGGSTSTSSSSAGAASSHLDTDSRSRTISMSGSSVRSAASKSTPDISLTISSSTASSNSSTERKKSKNIYAKTNYAVIRPTEAPPAPPPNLRPQSFPGHITTTRPPHLFMPRNSFDATNSPTSENNDQMLLMANLQEQETYMSSLFQTEPLYQFYDSGNVQNDVRDPVTSENMYECVEHPDSLEVAEINNDCGKLFTPIKNNDEEEENKPAYKLRHSRPSAMDLTSAAGGRRSMWAELPEVIGSGILETISNDGKKLHEAMFEVITSEASYLKSLNILIRHFAQSEKLAGDQAVIGKRDYRILFSDVIAVRQCSERFLEDLEKRWQSSVLLHGLCDVVREHARKHFQVYVKYCSNQVYQDRILKKLRSENTKFVETLRELESSPVCQSLAMHSFLMLPMQRITRLPLLIDAIFNRLNSESPEYQPCKQAMDTLNKLVQECNESARTMERMEEMLIISQQLDFREVRAVPLISASRWLIKRGDATRMYWKENAEAKLTFGRRVNKQNYNLLLFTDLLVVAKRKSDDNYLVVDYCPRNLVQMTNIESADGGKLPYGMGGAKGIDFGHLLWFTLLQNHENKTVEWLLSFNSECERHRWMDLVTPQTESPGNPSEKIYEDWDCPLVEAVSSFSAKDSDEVQLQRGDKANVLRKLSDSGWYYIERHGDGVKGWVPMSATREIESSHIRARNFKQRHAFLKLLTTASPEHEDEDTNVLLTNSP